MALAPEDEEALHRMIEAGMTITDAITAFAAHQPDAAEAYITQAGLAQEAGVVEVDVETMVSAADDEEIEEAGGTYVLAWVWVDTDDLEA